MYVNAEQSWWQLQDLARQQGYDLRQEPSDILENCNYFVLRTRDKVLAREPAGTKGLVRIRNALEALQYVPRQARVSNVKPQKLLEKARQQLHSTYNFLTGIPRQQQERAIANTALQLFVHNYQRTGDDCYRAQHYTISLQDKDTYSVTDRQGQLLLSFKASDRKVRQVLNSRLSGFHYMEFARARCLVAGAGIEAIPAEPRQRAAQLGNLAPLGDRELLLTARTQQVASTVKDFLNRMAISRWSAPDGNYSYEVAANGDLRITSHLDGRGDVLSLTSNGVESKLAAKDFIYFADLRTELDEIAGQQRSQSVPTSNAQTLAALLSARKIMDAFSINRYQDANYSFLRQGENIFISSRDGRGELARFENNEVTGNLALPDILYFQDLDRLTKSSLHQDSSLSRNSGRALPEIERD